MPYDALSSLTIGADRYRPDRECVSWRVAANATALSSVHTYNCRTAVCYGRLIKWPERQPTPDRVTLKDIGLAERRRLSADR